MKLQILFSILFFLSFNSKSQEVDTIRVKSFFEMDTSLIINSFSEKYEDVFSDLEIIYEKIDPQTLKVFGVYYDLPTAEEHWYLLGFVREEIPPLQPNLRKDSILNFQENKTDTLLNTSTYLIIGDSGLNVFIVNVNEVSKYPNLIEYSKSYSEVVLLNQKPKNLVLIYKRYKPQKSFEDFSTDVYKGELKEPNFETNPKFKKFITRIKDECKSGVNFAGHYTLVTWGCGSPCQRSAIVDRKTGEIFDGLETTYGIDFKKDSRMIIKNDGVLNRETNLIKIHGAEWYELTHVLWDGKKFKDLGL